MRNDPSRRFPRAKDALVRARGSSGAFFAEHRRSREGFRGLLLGAPTESPCQYLATRARPGFGSDPNRKCAYASGRGKNGRRRAADRRARRALLTTPSGGASNRTLLLGAELGRTARRSDVEDVPARKQVARKCDPPREGSLRQNEPPRDVDALPASQRKLNLEPRNPPRDLQAPGPRSRASGLSPASVTGVGGGSTTFCHCQSDVVSSKAFVVSLVWLPHHRGVDLVVRVAVGRDEAAGRSETTPGRGPRRGFASASPGCSRRRSWRRSRRVRPARAERSSNRPGTSSGSRPCREPSSALRHVRPVDLHDVDLAVPSRSLLNAILVPSGDHAGVASGTVFDVGCVWPVPSSFITKISESPSRSLRNTTLRPPGDQAGFGCSLLVVVSCLTRAVSVHQVDVVVSAPVRREHDALPVGRPGRVGVRARSRVSQA